jgi:hypothetical protein
VVVAVLLVVAGPAGPTTTNSTAITTLLTVKPEAAAAVVDLLMMGVRTPETCCAVNKCQYNKLEKLLHLVGDLFELYDDARTSLYIPSSFSSVFLVLSFVSASSLMLFWVIFLLPFSEHGRTM